MSKRPNCDQICQSYVSFAFVKKISNFDPISINTGKLHVVHGFSMTHVLWTSVLIGLLVLDHLDNPQATKLRVWLIIWGYFILYFSCFCKLRIQRKVLGIFMHKLWFSNDERKLHSIFWSQKDSIWVDLVLSTYQITKKLSIYENALNLQYNMPLPSATHKELSNCVTYLQFADD